mgnify:CR=1 FL=1
MDLLRLGPPGQERPAVRHEGAVRDLSPLTSDIDGAFLASGGIERTRAALREGGHHVAWLAAAEALPSPGAAVAVRTPRPPSDAR